ncbi:MAG: aspartyl/glutamyl-tRNA amidotransferase subunit A [Christensenellaceae bacterium]|jgi:aspartyl-tRNA(Asn)/glutamyl-tRNA(Gln) amidotransferase subunit A|nr:aspartyl/glutamyl-tRNA amidotransferase subunit A [Christensenellaceae bacterium]
MKNAELKNKNNGFNTNANAEKLKAKDAERKFETPFETLTVIEFTDKIKNKEFSAYESTKYFLQKCKESKKNALLEVFDNALDLAKAVDRKIANGEPVGVLAGVPIVIKDNILYKGHISSAASKLLANFVSPYNATVVQKLLDADAVIIARANQDEFAMGTTGGNSAFGIAKNGLNDDFVSGGSSSGSAAAVAGGLCLAALGTDTGGSVRCPACWNGIVGVKPTYGTISRYGLIAFASSIEQCGIFTKTVADNELLYSVLCGKDINDATTLPIPRYAPTKLDIKKLKIGRVKEVWQMAEKMQNIAKYNKVFDFFEKAGATIVDVSIKNIALSLAGYYTVATAEAASNLSRFDGVKYGMGDNGAENIIELYKSVRSAYFGNEVKRRIMTGNYNLGAEDFETYRIGTEVFADVKKGFAEVFNIVDCVLIPTTTDSAPRIDEKITDPIQLYLMDLFTVPANVAGVPAVSVPCGMTVCRRLDDGNNKYDDVMMPIGLQILCAKRQDSKMFGIANYFEKNFKFENSFKRGDV